MMQKVRTSTGPPSIYLEGPFQDRIEHASGAFVTMITASSDQTTSSAFPGFSRRFFRVAYSAQLTLLVSMLQKETDNSRAFSSEVGTGSREENASE
jgi:hypothetical protein